MRNTLLHWIFLCLLFSSCEEECGIVAEPTLSISFFLSASGYQPTFTKIRALGSKTDIPITGVKSSLKRDYSSLNLPLNLSANATTYILEQTNRIDTLTVFYQKKTHTPSRKCGIVLDLEAPTIGKQIVSTFKQTNIMYLGYYGITESFSYRSGGGIVVTISLP